MTYRAYENLPTIWYHVSDNFDEFRELIRETWPGMDIETAEPENGDGKAILRMFCLKRDTQRIYWAGFGFQIWYQILTYVIGAKDEALLIIDEPDIYLTVRPPKAASQHFDDLGSDILIATHSTEIILEAEPGDILVVNKKNLSAKRIKDPTGLQQLFELWDRPKSCTVL